MAIRSDCSFGKSCIVSHYRIDLNFNFAGLHELTQKTWLQNLFHEIQTRMNSIKCLLILLQEILLIGDSVVSGLSRYRKVWSKYFEPLQALNFSMGGDRTQNVLSRLQNAEIPKNLQTAIIHCGANNIYKNDPEDSNFINRIFHP